MTTIHDRLIDTLTKMAQQAAKTQTTVNFTYDKINDSWDVRMIPRKGEISYLVTDKSSYQAIRQQSSDFVLANVPEITCPKH